MKPRFQAQHHLRCNLLNPDSGSHCFSSIYVDKWYMLKYLVRLRHLRTAIFHIYTCYSASMKLWKPGEKGSLIKKKWIFKNTSIQSTLMFQYLLFTQYLLTFYKHVVFAKLNLEGQLQVAIFQKQLKHFSHVSSSTIINMFFPLKNLQILPK